MERRGQVLIVRHGPGRGREVVTLEPALRRLAAERPELPAAIRFHETGSPAPPDLSGLSAIFFWLADPLRERYPACFEEAQEIALRARAQGIRLANPPEALSHTIKSEQARRWAEAGIPTPRHVAYADRSELEANLAGWGGPLLLKAEHLHAQRGMWVFLSGREALRSLDDRKLAYPGAIADFVDTRAGFRARMPDTVWSRFYHKKRALVLGDLVSPRSALFSRNPIVSLKTCTFRPPEGWRRLGYGLRPEVRACIRADREWWRSGGEQHDLMRHAAKALGLDVCGIDYASTAGGGVVLWEANPFFYLPLRRSYFLPRLRGFEARYRGFVRDLGAFLEALRSPLSPLSAPTSDPEAGGRRSGRTSPGSGR